MQRNLTMTDFYVSHAQLRKAYEEYESEFSEVEKILLCARLGLKGNLILDYPAIEVLLRDKGHNYHLHKLYSKKFYAYNKLKWFALVKATDETHPDTPFISEVALAKGRDGYYTDNASFEVIVRDSEGGIHRSKKPSIN